MRPDVATKTESRYLLSHPGQSALASGSQAAFQGGRSRSSWPQPDGRQHRTHPKSVLHLYQSLIAPLKHKLDTGESRVLTKCITIATDVTTGS